MELPLRDSINWAPEGMRLRFEPARLAALRSAVPRDCYFCLSGRYLLKQMGLTQDSRSEPVTSS
jgi:hypothetical protein